MSITLANKYTFKGNTNIVLSINILDENDSPPVLQYTKGSIQISEYHDLDEQVAQIKATDADDSSTLNGMVEFKLVDGTGKGIFQCEE